MKISIALATFNGAAYLGEQLDSIKRQSLQPDELVVCDDRSSDETVEIARRFADDVGFKVIVDAHEKLQTYNENFVRAIGQCTGDIVVLCDQDDVWADNKLAATAAKFHDETVMAVVHRVQIVDERLQPTPLILPQEPLYGEFTVANLDPWFGPAGMQLVFRRLPIAPWLLEPPPLSKWCNAPAAFDEWIFFLAGLAGKRLLMSDVLGVWRRHSSSTTGSPESTKKSWSRAFQWKLAASTGAPHYAYTADVANSRAVVAERVAGHSERVAPSALQAATLYRRISQTWQRRSQLHADGSGRAARLLILTEMLRNLDYRSRDLGGLGRKSLLKDSFAALRGPSSLAARPAVNTDHAGGRV